MARLQVSGENTTDRTTGIPVIAGPVLVMQDGSYLVTQTTGEPPGGLNMLPGTDPNAPGVNTPIMRVTSAGLVRVTLSGLTRVTMQFYDIDIGLPYGFTVVPATGPLT